MMAAVTTTVSHGLLLKGKAIHLPDGRQRKTVVLVYDKNGKCTNEDTYWQDNTYRYNGDLTVYAQWKADPVTTTAAVTTSKIVTTTTKALQSTTTAATTSVAQLSIDKTSIVLENGQQYIIEPNQRSWYLSLITKMLLLFQKQV